MGLPRQLARRCARQALALCRAQRFDLDLLDVILPEMSGLQLLPQLRSLNPRMGVLLMTARSILSDAVVALRDLGAMDYIEKPFDLADLRHRVRRAVAHMGG